MGPLPGNWLATRKTLNVSVNCIKSVIRCIFPLHNSLKNVNPSLKMDEDLEGKIIVLYLNEDHFFFSRYSLQATDTVNDLRGKIAKTIFKSASYIHICYRKDELQ